MANRLHEPSPPAPWPRRAALVVLVALVCGCSSLQAPRGAPQEASLTRLVAGARHTALQEGTQELRAVWLVAGRPARIALRTHSISERFSSETPFYGLYEALFTPVTEVLRQRTIVVPVPPAARPRLQPWCASSRRWAWFRHRLGERKRRHPAKGISQN